MVEEQVVQSAPPLKRGVRPGRPNETKISLGLRIYPSDQQILLNKYGSIQKIFDKWVASDLLEPSACLDLSNTD